MFGITQPSMWAIALSLLITISSNSIHAAAPPTSQPTSNPSMDPSTQPVANPSGMPTVRPTIQPSSWPSRQPTSRPTTRPSTSQPSSTPSAAPSKYPSTSNPTLPGETLNPSRYPSASPTYTLDDYDTSAPYQNFLSNRSYIEHSSSNNNSFVYSTFYYKGLVTDGSCATWNTFTDKEITLPYDNVYYTKALAYFEIYDFSFKTHRNIIAECAERELITQWIRSISTGVHFEFNCNGVSWRSYTCNGNKILCINCKHACVPSITCPGTSNVINTCESCDNHVAAGAVIGFHYDFKALYPVFEESPVVVDSGSSVQSGSFVTVHMAVTGPGNIYCSAFEDPLNPLSVVDIFMSGVHATTGNNTSSTGAYSVSLTLQHLLAETDYTIYCYTEDFRSHRMPIEEAVASSAVHINTGCCRSINLVRFQSELPAIYGGATYAAAVDEKIISAFRLNSRPPADILVTIGFNIRIIDCPSKYGNAAGTLRKFTDVTPKNFQFTASSLDLLGEFVVQPYEGCYVITIYANSTNTSTGSSKIDGYRYTDSKDDFYGLDNGSYVMDPFYEPVSFEVYAVDSSNYVPAPPSLYSAHFSPSGGQIEIMFNSDTNQPGCDIPPCTGYFPCDKIVSFASADLSVCHWKWPNLLLATLPSLFRPDLDGFIQLPMLNDNITLVFTGDDSSKETVSLWKAGCVAPLPFTPTTVSSGTYNTSISTILYEWCRENAQFATNNAASFVSVKGPAMIAAGELKLNGKYAQLRGELDQLRVVKSLWKEIVKSNTVVRDRYADLSALHTVSGGATKAHTYGVYAHLTAAAHANKCSGITMDASASQGHGGRTWAGVIWSVQAHVEHLDLNPYYYTNDTALQEHSDILSNSLNNQYGSGVSFMVADNNIKIDGGNLATGVTYTITLRLTNFLGFSGASMVEISAGNVTESDFLSTSVDVKATIYKYGGHRHLYLRSKSLVLKASVVLTAASNCFAYTSNSSNANGNDDNVLSSSLLLPTVALQYVWNVYEGSRYSSSIVSFSSDSQYFRLPPFSLKRNTEYTIQLVVSSEPRSSTITPVAASSISTTSAAYTIFSTLPSAGIKAVIAGGERVVVSTYRRQFIYLNAENSHSVDCPHFLSGDAYSSASTSECTADVTELSFQWSCRVFNNEFGKSCPGFNSSSSSSRMATLNISTATSEFVPDVYQFTVSVSNGFGDVDEASVVVTISSLVELVPSAVMGFKESAMVSNKQYEFAYSDSSSKMAFHDAFMSPYLCRDSMNTGGNLIFAAGYFNNVNSTEVRATWSIAGRAADKVSDSLYITSAQKYSLYSGMTEPFLFTMKGAGFVRGRSYTLQLLSEYHRVSSNSTLEMVNGTTPAMAAVKSNAKSYTSITVAAASAPYGGVLIVSPNEGVALSTRFALQTMLWNNDPSSMPLSYVFLSYREAETSGDAMEGTGTGTANHGITTAVLKQADEVPYAHTVLAPGDAEAGFAVVCSVTAVNALGATATVANPVSVIVYPYNESDPDQSNDDMSLHELLGEMTESTVEAISSAQTRQQAEEVINIIVSTAQIVNEMTRNCSGAPPAICADLNRYNCSRVINSCGACIDGTVGISGDGNTPCMFSNTSTYEAKAGKPVRLVGAGEICNLNSSSNSEWISVHNSSTSSPTAQALSVCLTSSCVEGRCESVRKSCPSTCAMSNDESRCAYVDTNGAELDDCMLGEESCRAVCVCTEGFYGEHCDLSLGTFSSFVTIREILCESVQEVTTTAQDATVEAVLARIGAVYLILTGDTTQLSSHAFETCGNSLVNTIIHHPTYMCGVVPTVSVDSTNLLDSARVAIEALSWALPPHTPSHSTVSDSLIASVSAAITSVLTACHDTMTVPIEDTTVAFISRNEVVRASTSATTTFLSPIAMYSGVVTLSVPRTPWEVLMHDTMHTQTVSESTAGTTATSYSNAANAVTLKQRPESLQPNQPRIASGGTYGVSLLQYSGNPFTAVMNTTALTVQVVEYVSIAAANRSSDEAAPLMDSGSINTTKPQRSLLSIRNLEQYPYILSVSLTNNVPIPYSVINLEPSYLWLYCDHFSKTPYNLTDTCPDGTEFNVTCPADAMGHFNVTCRGHDTMPLCTVLDNTLGLYSPTDACAVSYYDDNITICDCDPYQLISMFDSRDLFQHKQTTEAAPLLRRQQGRAWKSQDFNILDTSKAPYSSSVFEYDATALFSTLTPLKIQTASFSTTTIVIRSEFDYAFVRFPPLLEVKGSLVIVIVLLLISVIFFMGFIYFHISEKQRFYNHIVKATFKPSTRRTVALFFGCIAPPECAFLTWRASWRTALNEDHTWFGFLAGGTSSSSVFNPLRRTRTASWIATYYRVLVLLTISTFLAFIFYADDEYCEQFDTNERCNHEHSYNGKYATDYGYLPVRVRDVPPYLLLQRHTCTWNRDNNSCIYNRARTDFLVLWRFVLLIIVLSVIPISFIGSLVTNVDMLLKHIYNGNSAYTSAIAAAPIVESSMSDTKQRQKEGPPTRLSSTTTMLPIETLEHGTHEQDRELIHLRENDELRETIRSKPAALFYTAARLEKLQKVSDRVIPSVEVELLVDAHERRLKYFLPDERKPAAEPMSESLVVEKAAAKSEGRDLENQELHDFFDGRLNNLQSIDKDGGSSLEGTGDDKEKSSTRDKKDGSNSAIIPTAGQGVEDAAVFNKFGAFAHTKQAHDLRTKWWSLAHTKSQSLSRARFSIHHTITSAKYGAPSRLAKKRMCKLVGQARHSAEVLRNIMELESSSDAMEILLMKNFVLECFHGVRRDTARYYLYRDEKANPTFTSGRYLAAVLSVMLLFVLLVLMCVVILYCQMFIGSRAISFWLMSTFIALFTEAAMVQSGVALLRVLSVDRSVCDEISHICHALALRFGRIVNRQRGVMSGATGTFIQHFNSSCRVARMLPELPVSRFLVCLNDFDVPFFRGQQRHQKGILSLRIRDALPNAIKYGVDMLFVTLLVQGVLLCFYALAVLVHYGVSIALFVIICIGIYLEGSEWFQTEFLPYARERLAGPQPSKRKKVPAFEVFVMNQGPEKNKKKCANDKYFDDNEEVGDYDEDNPYMATSKDKASYHLPPAAIEANKRGFSSQRVPTDVLEDIMDPEKVTEEIAEIFGTQRTKPTIVQGSRKNTSSVAVVDSRAPSLSTKRSSARLAPECVASSPDSADVRVLSRISTGSTMDPHMGRNTAAVMFTKSFSKHTEPVPLILRSGGGVSSSRGSASAAEAKEGIGGRSIDGIDPDTVLTYGGTERFGGQSLEPNFVMDDFSVANMSKQYSHSGVHKSEHLAANNQLFGHNERHVAAAKHQDVRVIRSIDPRGNRAGTGVASRDSYGDEDSSTVGTSRQRSLASELLRSSHITTIEKQQQQQPYSVQLGWHDEERLHVVEYSSVDNLEEDDRSALTPLTYLEDGLPDHTGDLNASSSYLTDDNTYGEDGYIGGIAAEQRNQRNQRGGLGIRSQQQAAAAAAAEEEERRLMETLSSNHAYLLARRQMHAKSKSKKSRFQSHY